VELILWVNIAVWRATMTPRFCDGIFFIGPLVCQNHEVIDGLGLASSQFLPEVQPDEAILKSIDGSFGRDIL
jgi:hypothetical protein